MKADPILSGLKRLCESLFLAVVLTAFFVSPAHPHGTAEWIMNHPKFSWCCGEDDCSAWDARDIAIVPGGYRIKSLDQTIALKEVKPSKDNRYWVCVYEGGGVRCLFVPMVG